MRERLVDNEPIGTQVPADGGGGMLFICRAWAAVICALVLSGAYAQTRSPAAEVASAVLARTDWVADVDRCPSSLLAKRETMKYLERSDCRKGDYAGCLARCSAGEAGACYWLGQRVQADDGNQRAVEVLFQRSCKMGVMSGCTNRAAGMSLERPKSVEAQTCAAETFAKVCEFDDPWACTMYALHLSRGMGVKQDKARALEVLRKSCKYGPEDQACMYGERMRRDIEGSDRAQGLAP